MEKSEAIALEGALKASLKLTMKAFADWQSWWSSRTFRQRYGVAFLVAAYWLGLRALHGFRADHAAFGGAAAVLYYAGPLLRLPRMIAMPFIMTGIIYDSMRFYADYIRGPIHVTQPYAFDKYFFGILTEKGVLTPNEYWQLHLHPALDFVTGLAYLVFIIVFGLQCIYFLAWLGRKGTGTMSAGRVREKSFRMLWSFFWVNMAGYTTYYWYAASPPWYVARYGLGPARTDVPASSAGCVRFDQLLGTHFFSEMYGRAADVHGAIPSLHVAYPFLAVLFSLQFARMRAFSIGFYLLMCFSAVYLNHHYVLDILWGSSYALLTALAVDWVRDRQGKHELPA